MTRARPGCTKGSRKTPFASKYLENGENGLAFGELEALACAFLPVLLPLVLTRVASEKAGLLQLAPQLGIKFDQRAGNAQTSRPGLSGYPAAIGENHDVEPIRQFSRQQRLANISARRFIYKIMFKRPVIDRDLTLARSQEHSRRRRFSPAGP